MLSTVPTGPLAGENLPIPGAMPKSPALSAVPPDVVTLIRPVAAPAGTIATSCVRVALATAVATPLNLTASRRTSSPAMPCGR